MTRDFDTYTSSKFLAHGEGTDTVQELNLSARLSLGGFRIYPKSTPLVAGFRKRERVETTVCILQSAIRESRLQSAFFSLHSSVGNSRVETTVCILQSAFYSRQFESRDYSLHSTVGNSRVETTVCILQSAIQESRLQSAFYSLHYKSRDYILHSTVCILQVKYGKRVTSANTSGWYLTSTTNKSNVHQPIIHLHLMI